MNDGIRLQLPRYVAPPAASVMAHSAATRLSDMNGFESGDAKIDVLVNRCMFHFSVDSTSFDIVYV